MGKVRLSLKESGCRKPGCKALVVHRHHKRHEFLFVACFSHRWKEAKYKEFKARYERFESRDTVRICARHHAEIHHIYNRIIRKWKRKRSFLVLWSWEMAEALMDELEHVCEEWMKQKTPGVDPKKVFR